MDLIREHVAVGFATYGYVNAKDYDGLAEHLIIMRSIERTMSIDVESVPRLPQVGFNIYPDCRIEAVEYAIEIGIPPNVLRCRHP